MILLHMPQSDGDRLQVAALQVEVLEGLLQPVEGALRQGQVVVGQLEGLEPQRDESVVGHKLDPVVGDIQAAQDPRENTMAIRGSRLTQIKNRKLHKVFLR